MTHARGRHGSRGDRRDVLGLLLRGTGQTLLTCGFVVLLFVVYEVWVTNIFAEQKQATVHRVLTEQWRQGQDLLALPPEQLKQHAGEGIANLYIPRLGPDYAWTVVEGNAVPVDSQLTHGPAHYGDTQLPGQPGNFAMAGHRVGKGEPFLNLDKLEAGDAVIVETATKWFIYCVIGAPADACDPTAGGLVTTADANGVVGREVVPPSAAEVIAPVPNDANANAPYPAAYLTMTTCTPKFTATDRLIVHAVLDPAYPTGIAKAKSGAGYSSELPPQVQSLYEKASA